MAVFAVNDNLFFSILQRSVELLFYAFLQTKYYGTGGINNFYLILFCQLVSCRWFSMGTE